VPPDLVTGRDSTACTSCHQGIEPMHAFERATERPLPADWRERGMDRAGLTCVDCHGGNGALAPGAAPSQEAAHVPPRNHAVFASSANPQDSYAALNEESPEFVRFMNPSDFRVGGETCGECHGSVLSAMRKSVMSHNGMVHAAVFYNNGGFERKQAFYGEAFDREGKPANLVDDVVPAGARQHGAIDRLVSHPQFPVTRVRDPLRVTETTNPALGVRGGGTDGRIAGVFLNVLKTRLNDPTTWFMGPNKIAGDYRTSGCASCHVIYANDRDRWAAGPFARFGNRGQTFTADQAMAEVRARGEAGHPIRHQLELAIPATQCLTCHYHQGDGAVGTYLGRIWWDRETDAERVKALGAEPEYGTPDAGGTAYGGRGYAAKGKAHGTSTYGAMADLADHNRELGLTQLADFHAHGWNFAKVYRRDVKGRLLDAAGRPIAEDDPAKWQKAVHLRDIHLEKGLHCIDCHTEQDAHGDGNLYPQMTDYIEIRCVDCHGTVAERARLVTSGHPWAPNRLTDAKTPFLDPDDPQRRRRLPQFFSGRDGRVYQRSKMEPGLVWQVTQLVDVVDPDEPDYNPRAAYAKLIKSDGSLRLGDPQGLAHDYSRMECSTCHSSWQTTCSGCHLPLDLNVRSKDKHYEDRASRGYAPYYGQVVRTDTFFLGVGTTNHGNKVTPFRPASSVVVSTWDRNRNNVVHQQPLLSAPGFANEAMTPHPPHTVRARETRQCTDCHPSGDGSNNARLAVLLGFGANAFNFMGGYVYVAEQGRGVTGVQVTEGREPQPVIGSNFHRVLHPESHADFVAGGRRLGTAYTRRAPRVQAVATRGEYLLAAEGPAGVKVYDVANINNKAAAQRIVQAANSPLGERTVVATRDATSVHLPVSLPVHVGGERPVAGRALPSAEIRRLNGEQPLHDLYRYALVTDREEGLILVDVDTLADGHPDNNRLTRAVTFNPEGRLAGARMVRTYGRYAYLVSEQTGLSVVDLDRPLAPRLVYQSPAGDLDGARAIEIQLRYAFALDRAGLQVFDLAEPERPRRVPGAVVPLADARGLTVARSHAYVAAGRDGLIIVDVEKPAAPKVVDYDRRRAPLDDTYDVAVGATNVSFFAYVADGRNGLKVVSLVEPPETPGHLGFAPQPTPRLIATYPTAGVAVAVNRGQIRDRYVDEAGNQIAVTNRLGSRPLNLAEIRRFLAYADGQPLAVTDDVPEALLHRNVRRGTVVERPRPASAPGAGGARPR
jgi:hypothetical protein